MNCDTIMHLCLNFDACPMYEPFGFVHLMHQNLSIISAQFCQNSLAKVNMQLLINKCLKFCKNIQNDSTCIPAPTHPLTGELIDRFKRIC